MRMEGSCCCSFERERKRVENKSAAAAGERRDEGTNSNESLTGRFKYEQVGTEQL